MTDLAGKRVWVMAKGYVPDIGGMQTYAQKVAEAYAAAGANVTVFTQSTAGPGAREVNGLRVLDIGATRGISVPQRYRKLMKQELGLQGAPDLLHATTWRTSLIPMSLRLPYIVTFHGREFIRTGKLGKWLMHRAARKARLLVAVSHYSGKRLERQIGPQGDRLVVAWNGISQLGDALSPTQVGDAPLVLSLCRLEPRKNIAACIRALAALRDENLPFRYAIAGRGPEYDALAAEIGRLGMEDRVELLGFVPDERAAALYREAEIFLHPQIAVEGGRDFEGFGIAIADAMEATTACIVGKEGGTVELVEDGTSGLIVDGRDTAALTDAIRSLLLDPQRRRAIGEAARARARMHFTWQRHIARILERLPG